MNKNGFRVLKRAIGQIFLWSGVAFILFFFLFPLYWILISSLKSTHDVTVHPPKFIPVLQFEPTLDNYLDVLSAEATGAQLHTFPKALFNSTVIGMAVTFVAVVLGTLAAYAFSRFRVRGEDDWLFFILSTRMLPPVVVIIPIFLMFNSLKLRNSFVGLSLLYVTSGLPFVVWMMKGFFDEIPREYEEAAMIDGCSRLEAVLKIVLPEALPPMLATAVFVLITAWNEFVWATLLNPNAWSTVPPFLYTIIGWERIRWGPLAAASFVFIAPIVVFTFLVRNHLLRGVTFGVVRR